MGVRAKAASGAHERPFVGVLEPHMSLESSGLHSGVVALGASVFHLFFGSVFAQHVRFQGMIGHTLERAKGAGFVHFQFLPVFILFVLDSQVFDQVHLLRRPEFTKAALMQNTALFLMRLQVELQADTTLEGFPALLAYS